MEEFKVEESKCYQKQNGERSPQLTVHSWQAEKETSGEKKNRAEARPLQKRVGRAAETAKNGTRDNSKPRPFFSGHIKRKARSAS